MADYNGTDDDDIIDASELDPDIGNIRPGEGNDTITNATGKHTIVSSPGEDNISGEKFGYALWNATQAVTINLKENWTEDGFGSRDTISGVEVIHGSRFGDTFYGTENYEKFFANGGNNILNMGGGDDLVSYANGNSKDYTVNLVGEEIHVTGPTTKDIIIGGRYVEFMNDNKLIDTDYLKKPIKSNFIELVHSFEDATETEAYSYSGADYEAGLISWFPQKVFIFDVNNDGEDDVILPMAKGYAQKGINSATPFIALTVENGKLIFDEDINATMPIDAAAGRSKPLFLEATNSFSYVTSNIYTAAEIDRINPDYSITPPSNLRLTQKKGTYIDPEEIFPVLPEAVEGYPLATRAHSMATGDINGDGLDDIYMGRSLGDGGYELIQQIDGTFVINKQDVYQVISSWPLKNDLGKGYSNFHLDSTLIDVNKDGYDDLLIGIGHGSSHHWIFMNDRGNFTENNKIKMPDSIYGVDNQMPLLTFPADFDHDGDIDVGVLWTRYEPYYGGYYIQFNLNDGAGNYTDVTNLIPSNFDQDAYQPRLTWVEPWQMIDINDDGHIDLAGSRSPDALLNYAPIVYFNDGAGRFEIKEVGSETSGKGKPYAWGDFDKDGKIEYITFKQEGVFIDGKNTKNILNFNLFEYDKILNTGPDFINTSDQSAPGFNEHYYLNENSSAKELVDAGTYSTGLEHYLAEGKDGGLNTFAPFTKVHGYSGNDNIVLREGDETAFGYAGKDTIEGGAGNDIIDGGAGLDSAIYKDSSSAYSLTANDDGTVSVVHSSPSEGFTDEGSDTLTSIEKMQFSDKTLSKTSLKYELSESIDPSENILSAHTEDVLSGTLNFNKGDNIIILDGQGKTYRGLEGDDTYFISQLLPKNGKVSITDTEGSNLVQLPANTYVDKSLFTKNAARLTLEDGREITISGADKFSYNAGGNITDGTKGIDLTFTEFAEVFGVYDILNSSGAQTGAIADMYII